MLNPTTPASTPLDTLKALALRNIDQLEYVTDQLGGGDYGVPEDLLEFIDAIRHTQYDALNEHVPVKKHELFDSLRRIAESGYTYSDGSPVVEHFKSRYGTSVHFPRYNGPRAEALARHEEWTSRMEREAQAETDGQFTNIVNLETWRTGELPAED